jgi:hypothetical protein
MKEVDLNLTKAEPSKRIEELQKPIAESIKTDIDYDTDPKAPVRGPPRGFHTIQRDD